jgi:hypothetical protein
MVFALARLGTGHQFEHNSVAFERGVSAIDVLMDDMDVLIDNIRFICVIFMISAYKKLKSIGTQKKITRNGNTGYWIDFGSLYSLQKYTIRTDGKHQLCSGDL